jgi:SOS-response transcriptional repressor LexA
MPTPSIDPLTEKADRLVAALKHSGLSREDLSERTGISINTIKANLNGYAEFSRKRAEVYGRALKVRPEWLYYADGPMLAPARGPKRPAREIPIISWVSAGGLAEVAEIHEEPTDTILISDLPAGDWFVTEVRGDSMDRISPDGSQILVRADEKQLVPGGYYMFSLRGEATYKRYQSKPIPRLEPCSTNPTHQTIFLTEDPDWMVVGRVFRTWFDLM